MVELYSSLPLQARKLGHKQEDETEIILVFVSI